MSMARNKRLRLRGTIALTFSARGIMRAASRASIFHSIKRNIIESPWKSSKISISRITVFCAVSDSKLSFSLFVVLSAPQLVSKSEELFKAF